MTRWHRRGTSPPCCRSDAHRPRLPATTSNGRDEVWKVPAVTRSEKKSVTGGKIVKDGLLLVHGREWRPW